MTRTKLNAIHAALLFAATACSGTSGVEIADAPDAGSTPPPLPSATGSVKPDAPAQPPEITIPTPPSGGTDAGPDAAPTPPPACPPKSTATATTTAWKPPHALHQAACTAEHAAAMANCFASNNQCDVLVTVACHDCAVSTSTSIERAALIVEGSRGQLNISGCVAQLAGDPSANGCGPKVAAKLACNEDACSQCSAADRPACAQAANSSGACATIDQAASCATPYLQTCFKGATSADIALNLVNLFCGPP